MKNSNRPWLFVLILLFQMLVGGCRLVSPVPQSAATGSSSQQVLSPPQATEENPTLASIKQVSDFPLYSMRYEGDYGFGEYLRGLKQKLSSETSVVEIPPSFACTGFTARSPRGERLLGRNFDR
jgi:hypothetical protein